MTIGCTCLANGLVVPTVPGTLITSHFGNSWVMDSLGAPKWANYAVSDIWVASDGTTYNGSGWDEAAQEIGIYKNGDKIGKLNSTHDNVDGKAITGNATYVYANDGNFFRSWNRSTRNLERSEVDTTGQVWGLGADANRLFVGTDAAGGKIIVYDPSTLAYTSEWAFARPGRMSVDSAGNLWVLQRSDATNAPRAVKFSPTGTQLATITFASGVNPTDIAADGTARVLVADGGSNLNIKIYNTASLAGTPTTISDSLGTVGGVFAVSTGFVPGQAGANRFDLLRGVGIDSSGNYYISTFSGGSVIESYNSAKSRLWRVFGLEFEDCGDVDATNSNAIYTKEGKYTVNWENAPGQEATYWGTTLNPFKYPNDPRRWIDVSGNNNCGSRIVSAGGHKFMYVWDQQSLYLQVYRFDGEIAVPAALFCRNGSKVEPRVGNPTSNDPWDMWVWEDTNRDGQFDSTEFTTYRADNPYMYGWNVDQDGNVWKALRGNGIRKLTLTVDINGMPNYTQTALVANPIPFDSAVNGDARRLHYDDATDTMYISGFNSTNLSGSSLSGNDDRGAGRLMARYAKWSTGNRTASHTVQCPYNFNPDDIWNNHCTPEAFDVVGDYVFVACFDPGAAIICVYSSTNLAFVGEIRADRISGKIYGTDVDTPNGVNAFLRSNGEYVILQSNYGYANQLMFRWTPTVIVPSAPTVLSATVFSASQIDITWVDNSSNETGFKIERSTDQSVWVLLTTTAASNTSFSDTGLAANKTYYYRARSMNANGDSPISNVDWAITLSPVAGANGLRGSYRNNLTFAGTASLIRNDANLDFAWTGSPGTGIGADVFSVRWEGLIEAPATGSYTLTTVSDDGIRLWVNGVQLVDNWTDHASTTNTGTISLTGGTKYTIKMEFYDRGGGAEARLRWSYPGQTIVTVPRTRLFVIPSADLDTDSDGTNDLTEFRLGLNPTSNTSRFKVTRQSGVLQWPSAVGTTFAVQRSVGGAQMTWTTIATISGLAGATSYTDPSPPAGRAFYRVGLNP